MQLVTLEAHLCDEAGKSVLRTTIVERPDAVGVIAYDDRLDEVILVEQFRAGPHVAARLSVMLEIVAGYQDSDESTREPAWRELQEETGLLAGCMVHIATYFPPPTLSTEQISHWYGLVDARSAQQRCAHVVRLSGKQAIAMLLENRVTNALTLTALQWLMQVRTVLLASRREEAV